MSDLRCERCGRPKSEHSEPGSWTGERHCPRGNDSYVNAADARRVLAEQAAVDLRLREEAAERKRQKRARRRAKRRAAGAPS